MTALSSPDPVFLAQLEAKKQRVSLSEMLDFARDEACRIETVQTALMTVGLRTKPDEAQIRRLVVADAVADLVAFVQANESAVRAIKGRGR